MKKVYLFLSFLLVGTFMHAQAPIGGNHIYEFLNLSPSARVTGLAGNLITVKDDDVGLAVLNPSVLNSEMHHQLTFNHSFHLAGINHGYVGYGHQMKKWDLTLHGGLQYIDYGDFIQADEFGQVLGNFKASEYAFVVGAGRQLYDKLSVGANLKVVTSQFESYNSLGAVIDLGAYYQDTSGLFSMTLVFKNLGAQITTYEDTREDMPFDLQFGISRRLRYLPFRFSVVYHNLHRWNILYDDPNSEETTQFLGDLQPQSENKLSTFSDNLFRHLVFSGEFLLGKKENLRLRFGYSHFQRKELSVSNFRSLAGFAVGLGVKINRFRIEYGRGFYHLAGGPNHFTISTNINEFRR